MTQNGMMARLSLPTQPGDCCPNVLQESLINQAGCQLFARRRHPHKLALHRAAANQALRDSVAFGNGEFDRVLKVRKRGHQHPEERFGRFPCLRHTNWRSTINRVGSDNLIDYRQIMLIDTQWHVESANKLVVEARLKGAGMHWARASVNPMLSLRNAVCNDRWDEAWQQSSEHMRRVGRMQRAATSKQTPASEGPMQEPDGHPSLPLSLTLGIY